MFEAELLVAYPLVNFPLGFAFGRCVDRSVEHPSGVRVFLGFPFFINQQIISMLYKLETFPFQLYNAFEFGSTDLLPECETTYPDISTSAITPGKLFFHIDMFQFCCPIR